MTAGLRGHGYTQNYWTRAVARPYKADMTARRFIKMHGLGNDFVVLDARAAPLRLSADQVRAIADRRAHATHRLAQDRGKNETFADFRISVAEVGRQYTLADRTGTARP